MAEQDQRLALERWVIDGQIPEHWYVALCADPRFPVACLELSTRMLRAAEGDQALDGMVKDAGRFLAANWAVYLHLTGGLTLPRLKDLCATSNLLSPGRARAVLIYLQYLGYVRPLPLAARGETRRYAPTPSLMRAFQTQIQAGLEAACVIEPAMASVLTRLDEPAALEKFLKIQGDGFVIVAPLSDQTSPFFRIFLHRHAGMQMLHLILVSAAEEDGFPPRGPVSISAAAAARRLRVSRPHVMRLLADAEREGLLTRGPGGTVTLSASTRDSIQRMLAARLIGYMICAAKTAREISPLEASRPTPAPRLSPGGSAQPNATAS